jgi:Flp pilus assembly secretin CpaC
MAAVAALALTVAALLAPATAWAQTGADSGPRAPRARDMMKAAQDAYRNGDYEGAKLFFQQAEQVKGQLGDSEKSDLAAQIAANNTALQQSRDGAAHLNQASDYLQKGKLQEAAALVKAESANAYLRPADRMLLAQLNDQLRAKGVTALAGGPSGPAAAKMPPVPEQAKEDYRTLVKNARTAFDRGDLDAAESYCKQAQKAHGMIPDWVQPWNDNESKVLHDVQAARIKLAAAAAAQRERGSKQQDKKDEQPSMLTNASNSLKSMFTPAGTAGLAAKDPGVQQASNVVAGPAVNAPMTGQVQPSKEMQEARQLRDQAIQALIRDDLQAAKRFAEMAKAKTPPGESPWWDRPSPDELLVSINEHLGVKTPAQAPPATAQAPNKPAQQQLPPPPGSVPHDSAGAHAMLRDARNLYAQGKLDDADRLCAQVAAAKVKWGLFEDNPDKLRADLKGARQKHDQAESVKVLVEARKLYAAGNYEEARVKAWKAAQLHGKYSVTELGDRPEKLLAEIDAAEARAHHQAPAVAQNTKNTGGTAKNDGPVQTPMAALNAKQRAQGLLEEARQLEKQGNLVQAQAKAGDARAAATEAYRMGLSFGPGEESPDLYLQGLASKAKTRIDGLCHVAEEFTTTASDPVRMKKAADSLAEARVLAVTFGLDCMPIDRQINWVSMRTGGNPAVAQATDLPANNRGAELLEQARTALKGGRLEEAKRFAFEAFDKKYNCQEEASKVLRSVENEEYERKRLDSDIAFNAAHEAFRAHDYTKAQAILANVDERLLSQEKQLRLREMAQTLAANAPPRAGDITQVRLQGSPIQAGPPGTASATDQPGGADKMVDTYQAMQKVQFDKAVKEGLVAQKEALKRAEAHDYDGAVELLKSYLDSLNASKLDADQVARLSGSVNRYIAQYQQRKAKEDFEKAQTTDMGQGRQHEQERTLKKRERDEQIVKLMDQYGQLMREGKFEEAKVVAYHVKDIDPESLSAQAAIAEAIYRARLKRLDEMKEQKEEWFLRGLDTPYGEYVGDIEHPLSFNKEIFDKSHKRKNVGIGISNDFHDPVEKHINRVLDERKVNLTLKDTPLYQAVMDLGAYCGDINIAWDHQALQDSNINKHLPLTQTLNNISLRSALSILLRDAKLTFIIQHQTIYITTEENARGKNKVVTYSVADLVVPIENHPSPLVALRNARWQEQINRHLSGGNQFGVSPYTGIGSLPPGMPVGNAAGDQSKSLNGQPPKPTGSQNIDELLIRLITHTIAPESWSDVGGKGTIQYYPLGLALVVNQTQDIQEQIVDLLQALRRLQDLEVAIEMRLVSVSEAFFEYMGVKFDMNFTHGSTRFEPDLVSGNFAPNGFINKFQPNGFWSGLTPAGTFTPDLGVPIKNSSFDFALPPFGGFPGTLGADGGISLGLAFLSDIQVFMFMEAAQGDRRTNVMQAPKITVFNGQTASISVGDELAFLDQITVNQVNGQTFFTPQQNRQGYGVSMQVTPVVSADRRFVRLNLQPQLQNLISATVPLLPVQQVVPQLLFDNISPPQPQVFTLFFQQPSTSFITLDTTVVVPDGGTVLMGGLKTLVEGRNEFGPPVLSKIPYISRLFKNVGYGREAQSLMIMVTARIIINEEEEQEFLGQLQRIPR